MEKDQSIGCVQPQILYASKRNILNAVGSFFTSTGFLYHYGYRKDARKTQYQKRLEIYSAKGAAILLRSSALEKVGLFDEDFFIFFEETDLCHRLWLLGYKVVYEPVSKIYHHEAVDTKRQMEDYTRNYLLFRNRICSFLKTLELTNMAAVTSVLLLIYFFLFLFYGIKFQFYLSLAIVMALLWNLTHLASTLKKRRSIQETRAVSDEELFLKVKKNPPLRYYYYLFTNLKNFKNEKPL